MRKIFVFLFSFLYLFSLLNLFIPSSNAATTNTGLDACYDCPTLPSPYNNPSGVKVEATGQYGSIPILPGGKDVYICSDGSIHEMGANPSGADYIDCMSLRVEDAICRYTFNPPVNGAQTNFAIALPVPVDGIGVCGQGGNSGKPVCSEAGQGCITDSTPEPTTCSKKNDLCKSQAECQQGVDCGNYWCVNKNTKKLISDLDTNVDLDNLICMHFPDGKPACGVPESEDPEGIACEDPFGVEENRECTRSDPKDPRSGDAAEKCFSGFCGEDGNCMEGYAPYNCRRFGSEFVCNTALGPISASPEIFVQNILRIVLGISGGILLILIILNGYKLMTSQGDPEKVKDAREGIIAAIAGILLIIFSLTLLQLITVDILGIPGFTE